jgi:hypothetical protein
MRIPFTTAHVYFPRSRNNPARDEMQTRTEQDAIRAGNATPGGRLKTARDFRHHYTLLWVTFARVHRDWRTRAPSGGPTTPPAGAVPARPRSASNPASLREDALRVELKKIPAQLVASKRRGAPPETQQKLYDRFVSSLPRLSNVKDQYSVVHEAIHLLPDVSSEIQLRILGTAEEFIERNRTSVYSRQLAESMIRKLPLLDALAVETVRLRDITQRAVRRYPDFEWLRKMLDNSTLFNLTARESSAALQADMLEMADQLIRRIDREKGNPREGSIVPSNEQQTDLTAAVESMLTNIAALKTPELQMRMIDIAQSALLGNPACNGLANAMLRCLPLLESNPGAQRRIVQIAESNIQHSNRESRHTDSIAVMGSMLQVLQWLDRMPEVQDSIVKILETQFANDATIMNALKPLATRICGIAGAGGSTNWRMRIYDLLDKTDTASPITQTTPRSALRQPSSAPDTASQRARHAHFAAPLIQPDPGSR